MTTTPVLGMTQLASGQAAPETAVNENDLILEFFATGVFISRTTTAQPASPANGDGYLLPASPTGTNWSGQGGKIALFINTAWRFFTAKQGMIKYVGDEDVIIARAGSEWFVQGTIDQWDANFTADGEMVVYAHTAQTIDEIDTSGTGAASYEKSTAAAPNTFSSATPPFDVEKDAKWKVAATGVSGTFAAHLKRTD